MTMSDRTSNEEIFISKSFLMKATKHRVKTLDDGTFTSGVNMALELLENIIENASEADVAHIVRCKDCKYRYTEDCAMQYECECGLEVSWENGNDYCSWGERRME